MLSCYDVLHRRRERPQHGVSFYSNFFKNKQKIINFLIKSCNAIECINMPVDYQWLFTLLKMLHKRFYVILMFCKTFDTQKEEFVFLWLWKNLKWTTNVNLPKHCRIQASNSVPAEIKKLPSLYSTLSPVKC